MNSLLSKYKIHYEYQGTLKDIKKRLKELTQVDN